MKQHQNQFAIYSSNARNRRYDNQKNFPTLNFLHMFTFPENLGKSPKPFVSLTKATSTNDDTNRQNVKAIY